MKRVTLTTAAVLAALACAGAGNLLSSPADAQGAPPAPTAQPGQPPAGGPGRPPRPGMERPMRQFDPTRHLEGRLAYMKTELKITAAQTAQWDKVAEAMRQNAQSMKQAVDDARSRMVPGQPTQPQNASDRMTSHARFALARATGEQQLAEAFKPLYDSMTPDQKKSADEMFGPHHRGHGGPRRG